MQMITYMSKLFHKLQTAVLQKRLVKILVSAMRRWKMEESHLLVYVHQNFPLTHCMSVVKLVEHVTYYAIDALPKGEDM